MEVPLADDVSLVRSFRPHGKCQHVIGMQIEKEIGQQAIVVNVSLIVAAETGQ